MKIKTGHNEKKTYYLCAIWFITNYTVTHALRYGEKIQIKNDMVELEKF